MNDLLVKNHMEISKRKMYLSSLTNKYLLLNYLYYSHYNKCQQGKEKKSLKLWPILKVLVFKTCNCIHIVLLNVSNTNVWGYNFFIGSCFWYFSIRTDSEHDHFKSSVDNQHSSNEILSLSNPSFFSPYIKHILFLFWSFNMNLM